MSWLIANSLQLLFYSLLYSKQKKIGGNLCNRPSHTVCFIDLSKLNLHKISLPWSKSVKQTVAGQLPVLYENCVSLIEQDEKQCSFCIIQFQKTLKCGQYLTLPDILPKCQASEAKRQCCTLIRWWAWRKQSKTQYFSF